MSMLVVGQSVDLTIDRLSYNGGRGVGRHNNFVVFVPHTSPGDIIKAKITAVKKSFAEGQLIEVLQASSHRVEPHCPLVEKCGGCPWQQVSYEQQLEQKNNFVAYFLAKHFSPSTLVEPIVPAPQPLRYRNRIQLHRKKNQWGFYSRGSRNLIPIDDCSIADPSLIEKIPDLPRGKSAKDLVRVEIALSPDGDVKTFFGRRPAEAALFSQVNQSQNENLIKECLRWVAQLNVERVIELYCGDGNFSFPLAENFSSIKIDAVELSRSSVKRAQKKLSQYKKLNEQLNFHAADAGIYLKSDRHTVDLVLLDPPRPGCDRNVIDALLERLPSSIIYISCNLATLDRDLTRLGSNYSLEKVTSFDMFPQTEYVETMALLRRSESPQ